jgi:hypothetical protein
LIRKRDPMHNPGTGNMRKYVGRGSRGMFNAGFAASFLVVPDQSK